MTPGGHMASYIGRRKFLATLGSAAVAWPLGARAQQTTPVIGFVYTDLTSSEAAPFVAAFHKGLREAGFIEGQNVAVEYRWAGRQYDRLPAFVAEMVHRQVAVIVGNSPPAMAAKTATSTTPIVFFSGTDPVKLGLVASFNRPGGNATGVSFWSAALEAKRLGLLHELLPQATVIAALVDPNFLTTAGQLEDLQNAGRSLGKQIQVLPASTESELDNSFATLAQQRPDALIVASAPFFNARRKQLVALADRHRIAAIYFLREFPAAGGLMSYGPSFADAFRQVGVYTGRILRGEKPAELPVLQPTKYELIINTTTAKSLGLQIPDKLLALADEVIE
jgi:putative tryptophan/tyrosine transport system substrate-binding protein